MADFYDLSNLPVNNTIGDILALPTSSYPFFWLWILAGIWAITTLNLYFKEKQRIGRGNILSCMSISCFITIILSLLGTIVGFISLEVMIYILVSCISIIAIWFFSK